MLRQVGFPVVVGDDQVLRAYTDRFGWQILPSINASVA